MTSELTVEQLNAIALYRQKHNIDSAVTDEAVLSIMTKNVQRTDSLKGVAVERVAEKQPSSKPVSQSVELTEEQAKDLTIQYLSEYVQSAIEIVQRQDGGWVTDGYDSIKEFFDAELSQKNVGEVLNGEIDGIGYLQKAQEGSLTKKEYYENNKARLKKMILKRVFEKDERSGIDFIDRYRGKIPRKAFEKLVDEVIQETIDSIPTMEGIKSMQHGLIMMNETQETNFFKYLSEQVKQELLKRAKPLEGGMKFIKGLHVKNDYDTTEPMKFEEVFKLERGTDYSELLIEHLAQKKGELNVATGAFNKYNQFATAADDMLKSYSKATTPISMPDAPAYIPDEPAAAPRLEALINLYQNYYAGSPDENAAKKNLELAIKKSGLPVMVTQDENGKMSADLSAFQTDSAKNRAINTILRFGLQEQKATLDKILGGKDIDSYVKAYESANTAAMGSQNSAELAKAMEEDNYTAIQVYTGGVSMAGMGLMVVGGLTGCVPLIGLGGKVALTGLVAKNTLGFTDALSRDHIQSDEVKELSKGLAMDLGGFVIGGYAGQKGLQVASNLLSKGASPWVALVAEKTTDFSLSLAGDLAMMGALQTSDTAGSLTQGNIMGIVVSTFTGIKASKQMFGQAQAQRQAIAITPDGRQVAVNPDDFALRFEAPETDNNVKPHNSQPEVSRPVSKPSIPSVENTFSKHQQRLREIFKEDNISNDYFRSILAVLKKYPDNAEFILNKLENAKFGKSDIVNFIAHSDKYNPENEQSNLMVEAMSLFGKYTKFKTEEMELLLEMPPEKLQTSLDIIKSCPSEDGSYPLIDSFKVLAEAEIEDVPSFKNFINRLAKLGKLRSASTVKDIAAVAPEKRALLADFVNIYEKTKESTGEMKNDYFRSRQEKLHPDLALTLAQFDIDKISALRDIYKVGSEDGENVYDFDALESLFNCSTEQIRMIERFANIRDAKGKYEYSSSNGFQNLSKCSVEKLQQLYGLTKVKDSSSGERLYDGVVVSSLATYPDDKLGLIIEFAKLKAKPEWRIDETSAYSSEFRTLRDLDKDKLELLLSIAKIQNKGYVRFDSRTVMELSGQNLDKLTEITEIIHKHPEADRDFVLDLKRKTLEQLQTMNGKVVDNSGLDAGQLELKNTFDRVFGEQTNLDADVIREACLLENGQFDAGAIRLIEELAPEQRFNYYDGTDFVVNTLKNFKNADGTVNYERYKELKAVVDEVLDKFPNLDKGTMTYDAMYSLAQRGDAARVTETLNYISTINNMDLVYDSFNIVKDLDGGIGEFKAVMDKYGESVTTGKVSRQSLEQFVELSRNAGGGGGVSAKKLLKLLDLAAKFEDKHDFNYLLNSLKPEIIDDAGKFFEFADAAKEFFDGDGSDVGIILRNLEEAPRQIDIDALKGIAEVYKPLNEKVNAFSLKDIFENLNEDNFPLLNKVLEKYNGKKPVQFERDFVSAEHNYVDIYDLRTFLSEVKTKEDAEFVGLLLDKGVAVHYNDYSKKVSLPDASRALEKAKTSPRLKEWAISNDVEDGLKILVQGWDNAQIEGYLSKMNDEQRSFFAQFSKLKNPNNEQLLHLGTFNDGDMETFLKVPPEKYEAALQLGSKLYDPRLVLSVAAELSPAQIETFKGFVDKGVSPENLSDLSTIIKSESTFGNKEAYDKLMKYIGEEENEALSVSAIKDIVSNPYNEKGFNYMMNNLETSDFVTPEALVRYIALDPENVDNLEFLKTSSHIIATPELLSEVIGRMDKSKMMVFNEMVNELKTHNDNIGYDMETLSQMMQFGEEVDPGMATRFQKLYRLYDENGNHIIPGKSLYGLAENAELAGRVLGELPSKVAKLDLRNFAVSDDAVKALAENMPNEFKVILFNNNGEFTAKEYTQLLDKLNNNEYLRDALAEFDKTGRINLDVFENKDIALGLIDNNPQLLGIIKSSPEMVQNNPQTIKQNLSMVNELIDEYVGRYRDFVQNNPGLLPSSLSVEAFMKEIDKAFRADEQSAMLFNLANIYGAKNVKSVIAKLNPKNLDGGMGRLAQFAESEYAPLFTKIFAMKDVGEAEFNLIMRVAEFTDTANNRYSGMILGEEPDADVKLLEQDYVEILEKIVANGKFDKQSFFEDVYKGLVDANVKGFDPMTPEQLRIIAESDFISNPHIRPQDWAEFTKMAPEVRTIISSLLEESSYSGVKKILSLADDNSNALAGMSFSDKMKMLDIVDKLKKEDIDVLEKAGYNINSAIMKVVKALSIEKKFIQTDSVKQSAFLKGIIANNNPRAEHLLKNTDFTTEEFAHGIPLKYPRAKFTADIEKILSTLSPIEQSNVLKYFDIYKSDAGYEGIPVIPKNSDIALSSTERAAAEKVAKLIDEFTTKNETLVKDPELKSLLDTLVQGLPEFTTVVGKAQHGTHAYTVDIHTLKVLQYAMNEPGYAKLSDQDKTILKLSALVHDFGKKEGVVDEGHAVLSSEYVSGILAKFQLPETVKYRIIELVSNHHWFAAYNKGEMSSQTVAALCRNPEDFEISKILAKADLLGVNDNFYLRVTKTGSREEFDAFTADKFSYVDEKLAELRKKANIVLDTQILNKGQKFPTVKAKVGGEETEFRVLNLTDANVTDLAQYGFAPGTTKDNARFTVHMTPNEIESIDGESSSPMNTFNILSATPTHHSVQSTSLISFNNNRTYGHRKFGFILDVDQSNISTANPGNVGSGTSKSLETFTDRLFSSYDNDRSWVKSEFDKALKRKGIEMDDETYGTLAKFLYAKKYGTQIYSGYVNEKASPDAITGRTGFTKELYAEYVSPKTTPQRKAEIFELCVASKTYVIRKDGTIGVEYASKTGGTVPDDGEFRIKAKDLREALEASRDELFQGSQHSELVSMTPRVSGLIARVSKIEDCPQAFLKFAKEHNLPIILIGYKNPAGVKN